MKRNPAINSFARNNFFVFTQNIDMKKSIIFVLLFVSCFLPCFGNCLVAEIEHPKLAIIIDDFGGWSRDGVEEMLAIPAPITCAVMPCLDNTERDCKMAHDSGKEIILHMPLEAHKKLPENWYGNIYVKNTDTTEVAKQKVQTGFESVKYAKGMNIHIASGVCQNKTLMRAIMQEAKEQGKFFIDSFTHPKSVCKEVAQELCVPFGIRTEFLEKAGIKSYDNARRELVRMCEHAKKYGQAIAIGHVGMEGGKTTARAILDMLPHISSQGIELCFVSQLVKV